MLAYETRNEWKEDADIIQKPHKNELHNVEQNQGNKYDNIRVTQLFVEKKGIVQCKLPDIYEDTTGANERGNTPKLGKWGGAGNQADHIIGFSTIKEYVSKLIEYSQIEEYRKSFIGDDKNWMKAALEESDKEKKQRGYYSGGLTDNQPRDIMFAGKVLDNFELILNRKGRKYKDSEEVKEVIRTAVAWMPGNIVISPPGIRENDTHNGSELDDEFFKIPELRQREKTYRKAYRYMRAVIEKPECRTIESFAAANKMLLRIAKFPGPFDARDINRYWNHRENNAPGDHRTFISIRDDL